MIEEGLDAVIVNPTGIIGPYDYAPSRMGETILRFRDGAIPVSIGGGFDFVDVRDLVAGMRAAVDRVAPAPTTCCREPGSRSGS
ncbi:MAG: hypothetical protein M5U19_01220 [Microthrixaceae bacterium]|nr:hypothetical protein [Microthrixaceae bacterium]